MANMGTSSGTSHRVQAQRKFAHAGNVYTGTLSLPGGTPKGTPSKDCVSSTPGKRSHGTGEGTAASSSSSKKKKLPAFSPPPNKRPKTEDFLTFLCYRG
jgi:hypothetical protein